MVRMRDVATMAGVSVSTVSHVVNNTRHVDPVTRRKVLDALDATGYRPPAIAATQTIGVALSALSNPYLADIVGAIEQNVARRGSMMLLGETHESAEREFQLVETLLTRRVDGVLLAPGVRSLVRTLPTLADSRVPTVLIDRLIAPDRFDQVGSENRDAMARAVDHLAAHGHRHIAFIAGLGGLPTTIERQHGFLIGLARNGLPSRPALLAEGGSLRDQAARAIARLLVGEPCPTAVITGNNFMTVGVLKHLNAQGIRVPDDIAVLGYDDFEWADLMESPITAISQDWTRIGITAVDLLFDRIDRPDRKPRSVRIPPRLVVRRSCGCAPKDDRLAG